VISVLFADLVGSTVLAERLDAEEVKLIVGEAVVRLVGEVERFGGFVKDVAGDGVLAFFGAPVAHEDDAERAVRPGLAVALELSAYALEVEPSFGIEGFDCRVGIGTGPVLLGEVGGGARVEYGAYGDTVNTTARLQGAAQPGTVLVDESTHHLVETLFEWGEPVALNLKGKNDVVVAYEARTDRSSAQAAWSVGVGAPYIGRDAELATGRQALDDLGAGVGAILMVTGGRGSASRGCCSSSKTVSRVSGWKAGASHTVETTSARTTKTTWT
jgi:class 3 adenylate cyclase